MLGERERIDWFVSLEWQGSIILLAARLINNILTAVSPITWLRSGYACFGKEWKPWFVEVWVLFLIAGLFICLLLGGPGDILIWWVAFYILIDALGATVRDIVAPLHHRDNQGGYILVYDAVRWLLMAAINVAQVILCFAVFALHYGHQFAPAVLDPISAVYFSAVSFLTLGYGDIVPNSPQTKMLVFWELLTFLIFLVVKLPIAVSVVRVKERASTTNRR